MLERGNGRASKVTLADNQRQQTILQYSIYQGMWAVTIRKVQTAKKFRNCLYDAIHGACLVEFWINKGRFK